LDPLTVTWDDFKNLFGLLPQRVLLFRGHASDRWELEPLFFREAKQVGLSITQFSNRLLPDVLHELAPNLRRPFDLGMFEELCSFLSLLQHHGFPTPLLDWTYSPYMAAYFAFRSVQMEGHASEYVRVMTFDPAPWNNSIAPKQNFDWTTPSLTVVRPIAESNPRLIAQQGAFTLATVASVRKLIEQHATSSRSRFGFYNVRLKVDEAVNALRDLDAMGINEQSMFPGIEGTCAALRRRFFMPDKVGETSPEMLRKFFALGKKSGPEGAT
jgi:hypothetical protein